MEYCKRHPPTCQRGNKLTIEDHAAQALVRYQETVGLVPFAPDVMRQCIVAEYRNHLQGLINEISLAQRDTVKQWDFGHNSGLRAAIAIIKRMT